MKTLIKRIMHLGPGGAEMNSIIRKIRSWLQGYDHEKYWTRREKVINPQSRCTPLLKLYYLLYIKRVDFRHGCSFGTIYDGGSQFATSPILPHGLNGIIVGWDAKIGEKCIIFHQVTIADGNVVIGDHVMLGAGAKVLPNVTIGNHVRVGANCVVVENIPDYATVVLPRPRVIIKQPYRK